MNEDLAWAIYQLRGFNEDLDEIANRLEALHSRTYTRDERQAMVSRLAGNYEDDLITAVALLAKELTVVPDSEAMNEQDRKAAEQHGQNMAFLLTAPELHQPAASAAALIDPSTERRCQAVTDKEREELSRKNAEKNARSEKPYPK